MTRTERAAFPRALLRDRSESKSGLDKSLRKGGSGQYNWGTYTDDGYLAGATLEVEERDSATEEERRNSLDERAPSSPTEEEKRLARDFRKTALKGQQVDLSAIARTSAAVSTSPTTARVAVV